VKLNIGTHQFISYLTNKHCHYQHAFDADTLEIVKIIEHQEYLERHKYKNLRKP